MPLRDHFRPRSELQPLPILPLWLGEGLVIPLDLEQSYEGDVPGVAHLLTPGPWRPQAGDPVKHDRGGPRQGLPR